MGAKARRPTRPRMPSKGFEAMCEWVKETAKWQAAMVKWGDDVSEHIRKCCKDPRVLRRVEDPPSSPKGPWE